MKIIRRLRHIIYLLGLVFRRSYVFAAVRIMALILGHVSF